MTNDHKCTNKLHLHYSSEVYIFDHQLNLKPIEPDIELYTCNHLTFTRIGMEDPRSFMYQKKHFILSSVVGILPNPCHNKMVLYNIDDKKHTVLYSKNSIEKNWQPFVVKDVLLFEYSIEPHVIRDINKIVVSTSCKNMPKLHGSAPPIDIGKYFLGLGHTHPGYKSILYIFRKEFPYNIISRSYEFSFQNDTYEFVTGMVLKRNTILFSYTVHDCINYVYKMYLSDVLSKIRYYLRCD